MLYELSLFIKIDEFRTKGSTRKKTLKTTKIKVVFGFGFINFSRSIRLSQKYINLNFKHKDYDEKFLDCYW